MYALLSTVAYQPDNPPSEAAAVGFAALIVAQPGYRGRFGLDAGGGERVHIYLFESAEAARAGLGGEAMRAYADEHIRPHYAGPSARVAAGAVRHADRGRVLTGMYVRLALLPGEREGTVAGEAGYLGRVAIDGGEGGVVVAAIYDAGEEGAGVGATRAWVGAVTVDDWRGA